MSHPLYNPRGATFPNSQRPIVHGQYGSLGSQSGLELGASRLGPGSMSTSRGGLMVNQQMPFALGQHQSQISQDFEAAIDRNIMGAREEVRRLTQILQQPKTADPRLRKDTRNEGLSSGRTGYTGTGGSSRSNKVDWSLYQAPNKPFASSSLDRSSCSTQEFQYSGFGGSGAARSLDSQPPPEQRPSRYTPENASSILANFGLSNEDLELLSHCPEDQLTLDNLPVVLREIRMRKANRNIADIDARSELMGSDPRHSKVIDYGHFSKFGYPEESADGYAREHLPKESPKYGREVPGPPFSGMGITKRPPLCQAASGPAQDPRPTNPFPARPSASQFILPSSSQPPSQMPLPQMLSPSQMPPQLGVLPLMTNNDISGGPSSKWIPFLSSPISAPAAKRLPTPTMMNDYSAATPRIFPHTCSLCIIECFQIKDWIEHQNTNLHIERCRLLRKQYPDWNVEAVSVSRPEPKSEYSSLKRRTRSHSYSRSPSPKRHHDSSSHRKRSRSPRQDDAKERVATAYPALRGFPVGDFPLEQKRDETLRHAFNQVKVIDGQCLQPGFALSYPYFSIIKDRLYRVTQDSQTKEDTTQLLIPQSRREMLFQTAHCNPMAGHLGQEKTLNRLMVRFYWPGIRGDVRRWCAACRDCQLVNPPATPKVPLHPLPLIEVPFERIGMDLVGPLERTARGHRFVLVLVDYATRYPEAVPLRNISVRSVAEALFRIISRVGIPKEIFTDQGTTFMSRTLRELYDLLGIKSVRTSVYHPQTDGLVEQFNQTLKSVIFKFVHDDAWNWDKWLEPLLFAVREVPQASTGFSPFELLYGRRPRSVLDVLRENWVEGPSNSKNEIQYILDLRAKLHTLGQLTQENLLQAQERQSRLYNKDTRLREFTPGDKILVLLPTSSSKLLAKWQGPFEVTRRVSEIDYEVKRTDRGGARQIYHLNLLKPWREVVPMTLATVVPEEEEAGAEQTIHTSLCMEREEDAKALPNCKNLTVHGKVIEISMEKDARDDDRNKSVQTEKTVNKEVTTTKPTQSVKVESTNTVKAPLSTKAKESTSVKTSPVTKAPQKPSDPKKSVQTAKAKPPAKGSERPVTKKIVKKAVRWRKNIVEVSDLPEEGVTEDELTKFAKPYGLISTPVIAITQQRAFLQMLNTEAAEAMVKACSEIPVKIQEKQITVKMMQPIDLYYAESLFRVLVGMKKSPVKKKPQAKGAKAPGKSAATEGKPNTIKAQKPAAAASTTDGAATSEATPTVGTASAQDNMTAVPPITTDQVTRTDADIMTEEPAVSLESSKAKIEVGSSILSSESAVADESEKAELELASSGLFEEHAVSVESVNVKHELASPVPTTEDTADKMETRTEETMPFAEVVESQKQEENEPQEESMDNQLETVAVEPVVVESESTELYTHLGASAPAEDFSEEAADEEQHSMAEEGPEALLTVDEVVDEETGGEEYQLDKELQGLVTLDEIAEEEELDSFKPETLVTLDETKGDDEEIEEVEQSETKPTSPNFKTPPRPEEPAQSPSQEEDACDLEEFCTMNFVTVDEVGEEEEEQPPSEEVKVQEAVKKTATRAKKRARQTSVRRSTRGKRGAAKSDKEPEEPEMSAEGEPAPTASKPESPPSAPDTVELDKPDSQKAETVRVPDSSSAEVVSSGSEERTGVEVDDNSESERVVVETPVADKKTTIKEEFKQRRETETREAPEAKKVCSHSPVIEDFTLPPYSPDNPIGADFVVPKMGFFCRLCSLFYGNEETAKKSHCGSLRHYQNLEKYYKKLKSQQQRGKSTLTTSSQSSASE